MRSRRTRVLLLLILVSTLLFAVSRDLWLPWTAYPLLRAETPRPAQAAYVFAGDMSCLRILAAAELVKRGLVPVVLVSSPDRIFGQPQGELAIGCAVAHGHPRAWFTSVAFDAHSTNEEATRLKPHLERLRIRDLLAVTSNYHTARAGRALRTALGPEFRVTMVSAPDEDFTPEAWWKNREARKKFLTEWLKTLAALLGI